MADAHKGREKLLNEILNRASHDRQFRQSLLTSPAEAIYREFGVRIPEQYHIRFIERQPDVDALIVLPDLRDDSELSPEELESIAGGMETQPLWAAALDRDLFSLVSEGATHGDDEPRGPSGLEQSGR